MRISDWSSDVCSSDLFVLGRGPSFGIALEAALKFKETCGIHAEAFSTAEVAHGPMAVIDRNFPILVFPPLDEARAGLDALLRLFLEKEAIVAGAGPVGHGAIELPDVQGRPIGRTSCRESGGQDR